MQDTTLWRYITSQSQEAHPLDKAEDMFRNSCQWRHDIQLVEIVYPEWRVSIPHPDTDTGTVTDTDTDRANKRRHRATSARARFGDLIYHGGLLDATCCIKEGAPGGPVLLERLGKIDLPGLYSDECKCANNQIMLTFFFVSCMDIHVCTYI